jgi:hypothetical protein
MNWYLPAVQNSPNYSSRQIETQGATLLFGPTSESLRIASYKFWNKFKFQFSLNFKGVQTILEKSHKFSKISSSCDILEYEVTLTHLYSNIRSSFTYGNRYLFISYPIRAGQLSILLPLSQSHHCTKLGKEYCKLD